jgi:hypothetical protein
MFGLFTFVGSLISGFLIDYIIDATDGAIDYKELFLITALFRFIASFGFFLIGFPSENL